MTRDERNELRKQSGLPLLSVERETRRLETVQQQTEFENYFKLRRNEFQHLWSDRSRGFLTNMGIYNAFRKAPRQEMREAHRLRP
jgi:hypothetical protein